MKITHITPYMYPGGAEIALKSLIIHLKNEVEFKVVVIPNNRKLDVNFAKTFPCKVFIGNEKEVLMHSKKSDLITYWGPVPVNKYFCNNPNINCIFVGHGTWARTSLEMGNQIIKCCIAVSESVKKNVCYDFKTFVIPPLINTEHLGKSNLFKRQDFGFENEDVILGFIGRLDNRRKLEFLIKKINSKNNLKGLFVCWGENKEFFKKMDSKKKCIFIETYENLNSYYQIMDIFCFPTTMEGSPVVMYESLYNETIFCGSSIGPIQEVIIDKVNGFLFQNNYESFSQTIDLIMDMNNEEKKTIKEKGIKSIYKPEDLSKKYYNVFKSIINYNKIL